MPSAQCDTVTLTVLPGTKCSGNGHSRCVECLNSKLPCVYDDNRQDRVRDLTSQKKLLVDLVQQLRLSADPWARKKIETSLDEVSTVLHFTKSIFPWFNTRAERALEDQLPSLTITQSYAMARISIRIDHIYGLHLASMWSGHI